MLLAIIVWAVIVVFGAIVFSLVDEPERANENASWTGIELSQISTPVLQVNSAPSFSRVLVGRGALTGSVSRCYNAKSPQQNHGIKQDGLIDCIVSVQRNTRGV